MAGEINGTVVLIQKGSTPATIVGQMEATLTWGGAPIDISNKSYGDFVTYLDDNLATKQMVFSGTIVYNNDNTYEAVKADAFSGSQDSYVITYPNGESYTANFVPTGLSDTIPHGDKVSTAISFNSSGTVTRTTPT